jgi:hypothetical protein
MNPLARRKPLQRLAMKLTSAMNECGLLPRGF